MIIKNAPFRTLFMGKFEYSDGGLIEQNRIHVYYPIEWLILADDKDNRKMLLLSKNLIDLQLFADSPLLGPASKTSWKDSFIREWLNDYFFNHAFSAEQKSVICTTHISPNKRGHRKTLDRIFLLSEQEYEKYLSDCSSEVNWFYVFVNSSDSIEIENDNHWYWWLRDISPDDDSLVEAVSADGELYFRDSNEDEVGIRPAMWIKY